MVFAIHDTFHSFFLKALIMSWNSDPPFSKADTSTLMSPCTSITYHSHRSQVCQRLAPCIWLIRSPLGAPWTASSSVTWDGGENYFNQIIASTQRRAMTLTLHNTKTVSPPQECIFVKAKSFLLLSQKPLFVWWHWGKGDFHLGQWFALQASGISVLRTPSLDWNVVHEVPEKSFWLIIYIFLWLKLWLELPRTN